MGRQLEGCLGSGTHKFQQRVPPRQWRRLLGAQGCRSRPQPSTRVKEADPSRSHPPMGAGGRWRLTQGLTQQGCLWGDEGGPGPPQAPFPGCVLGMPLRGPQWSLWLPSFSRSSKTFSGLVPQPLSSGLALHGA